MKRTLLALLLAEALAGSAWAVEGNDQPMPPEPPSPAAAPRPPVAPMPPLPPLAPMEHHSGSSTVATIGVKGAVTLRADTISADIEVVHGNDRQVKAELIDSSGGIQLSQSGDRVEVVFAARSGWPHIPAGIDGKLRVEVPWGSCVEITSASGDLKVQDIGGNVRLRSASGDARVRKAANVEAQLVSGDITIENVTGEVRLRTVSGNAVVTQSGSSSKLEFGTTSGDLEWTGACNGNCRIEARTTSGDVKLQMPQSSSFDLRFLTHSGDLSDELKMQTVESAPSHRGAGSVHARYGKSEGIIEVQTFSGDLHIARR
jgi:hypothetical protein